MSKAKRKYYLLGLKINGIKNIKKEIGIDFYKKTIDKNFNPERYRVKAIYGENGAGKSGIVMAVKILKNLLSIPNYLNDSMTQNKLDQIVNKTLNKMTVSMEFIEYSYGRKVYKYSISLSRSIQGQFEIVDESLEMRASTYSSSKYENVFKVKNGELVNFLGTNQWKEFFEYRSLNLLKTRTFVSNVLYNFSEIPNELDSENLPSFSALLDVIMLSIYLKVYMDDADQHDLYFLKNKIFDNNEFQINDIRAAFSGVNDQQIRKDYYDEYINKVSRLEDFLKVFKTDLTAIEIEKKDAGDYYECQLNLRYGDYTINKEFESTGIKKLIDLYDYFEAASSGGVVFIDEMDANLNDVYLCCLIEYFMYYGKGQLCFTTHNLDPMSILKKNKNSIDFLSSDNILTPWVSSGNAAPDNFFRNGMIKHIPFNVDATDFLGVLGD